YRRLRVIAHSSRINSAKRHAVQRSVSKPCWVGASANQRNATFSWVRVNLQGRPGVGRAANPSTPRRRYATRQRRTLLGSISRNSATSLVVYPSKSLSTAKSRRRSSSAAKPLLLMRLSVGNQKSVHYFSDLQ